MKAYIPAAQIEKNRNMRFVPGNISFEYNSLLDIYQVNNYI